MRLVPKCLEKQRGRVGGSSFGVEQVDVPQDMLFRFLFDPIMLECVFELFDQLLTLLLFVEVPVEVEFVEDVT